MNKRIVIFCNKRDSSGHIIVYRRVDDYQPIFNIRCGISDSWKQGNPLKEPLPGAFIGFLQ